MAEGNPQSRYVKLTREQEAPSEDITPGELNQPIQIPQVLVPILVFGCRFCEKKKIILDVGFRILRDFVSMRSHSSSVWL